MKSGKRAAPLWKVSLECDAGEQARLSDAIEDLCIAVSAFETGVGTRWRVEGLLVDPPDRARMAAAIDRPFTLSRLPPTDWLAENRRSFPPMRVGRFFIHGAHWRGRPPAGAIAIKLDAGMAFGSGEHATTKGCLLAIDAIRRRGGAGRRKVRVARDLGCGSGILAIAVSRALRRHCEASDIDADAVAVTQANARANGVERLVRTWRADGLGRHAAAVRRRRYDLIFANILARPLCRLARDIRRALAPRGRVVLAGLLAEQETMVRAAYRAQRLRLVRRRIIGDWHILEMARGR